jgi:hypothetical protein
LLNEAFDDVDVRTFTRLALAIFFLSYLDEALDDTYIWNIVVPADLL